ncbi:MULTISPECIES: hypothetical protein [Streptomycetaceae]|uniref:ATP-binding protein n=1 Tax=Streptantibioticus cattleyicolor (strain ATCC 35852 / DSM 46488 / JCM 4925 / NBRC 14057 / NRRL 8057) TaxID=1003195 RepID=F8K525_STREN|nr:MULTISPECIES: hypothetical protein [Streptomycetaceae]AEW96349.1 hypothetical protein SCATT_39780 [Streptantibioticus cattleyicolor NRRL 8057 = DSM 46488]MYS60864.1 ATP-binding protein [Streptomyces sp. SID5468]CCB76689.1 putative ATP-binding protein [Streptantibioticus cattleyicolor NRRL 8057 = DSM 46488]
MSLPLKRRIARAALLVAAAAPVVGMGASSASAVELPHSGLGGLTSPDTATGAAHTVDGAAHSTADLASQTGSSVVKSGLPAAEKVVGATGKTAIPAAEKVVGDAGHSVGSAAGKSTRSLGHGLPAADQLPVGNLAENVGHLSGGSATHGLGLG